MEKKVTEQFLVDADSVTEAETRAVESLDGVAELSVKSVSECNIDEIFIGNAEGKFYMVKVLYVELAGSSGRDKTTSGSWLIQNISFKHAFSNADNMAKASVTDCIITAITETKIVEYIKREA